MSAEHSHISGHTHGNFGSAFAVGIALNSIFVLIEAGFGIAARSMALIADAGHNFSDVLALLIAWGAAVMSSRPANARFTYGYKASSMLAALANAGLLTLALGAILYETVARLLKPEPVHGWTMIVVAAVGIVVNAVTAWLFARGRKHDINIRAAFVHMAADALVSLGVVIAGAVILWTGLLWIDPATSLVIVAVVGWGTWSLLKDSIKMALLAVPESIHEGEVRGFLETLPGVTTVHDLHIWPMSTTETALTAHLVMPDGHRGDAFLHEVSHELEHHFHIGHTTVQVETGTHADHCIDCA